jgi:hypothetical protein
MKLVAVKPQEPKPLAGIVSDGSAVQPLYARQPSGLRFAPPRL